MLHSNLINVESMKEAALLKQEVKTFMSKANDTEVLTAIGSTLLQMYNGKSTTASIIAALATVLNEIKKELEASN